MDDRHMNGPEFVSETKHQLNEILDRIIDFAPEPKGSSSNLSDSNEKILALNELADALESEAAQIKHYLTHMTMERLNELDGFDRCDIPTPPVDGGRCHH